MDKKVLFILLGSLLSVGAHAEEKGGLKPGEAPPPPHAMDEGYRGIEDARISTVEKAKEMHDGASVSFRGNLLKKTADDRFKFRDKTGEIDVQIPPSVFDEREVKPDHLVTLSGSLDKKQDPPLVRVSHLEK
ncbi:TIGR00156 family protein [Superficieibacter electus]|uniref:TIGR00156 family protein n=1 Tax=Superficieibacter electus TaxID=2022662 RepID=A0A2P5GIV6_9ENTR|nr:YdeI family stress tolerance OB fold protein [Superficieibacter electus]POP41201.1 TIGR00156 family protein [Superficieibacter electus]POP43306.1 TIGR00156 family protein [Superficieibacter electus]